MSLDRSSHSGSAAPHPVEPTSSNLARSTHLSEPPVVGRRYLVPTVSYPWYGRTEAWPVFLPVHNDARFFTFAWDHYHIDPRFLDGRLRAWVARRGYRAYPVPQDRVSQAERATQAGPLGGYLAYDPERRVEPLPPVVWRERRCSVGYVVYRFGGQQGVKEIAHHYAGQQCARSAAGWICPHQNFALGSMEPDADGIITCPLHGLRVRASDGRVEGKAERQPDQPTGAEPALASALLGEPLQHSTTHREGK